ncbi:type VI secretion protein [Iodobacter fluviatilis]|uniref:Type VI secretion protein n=1 Tax=Iodobacter fluviatilis TaxID=537 RepID=A0A7G3GCU2_9NEIS|nr:type VI secretion protein [Iodobacter fluviatilis]QBC44929.1 type VI secretion protein [Iodobacter fluviatilis]
MRDSQKKYRWVCSPLLCIVLAGCGLLKPSIKLSSVSFSVASMANEDTPIPIDLVVVDDEELLKRLLTLSAAQWFEQKAQLQRDFPKALFVWSRELVPGQRLDVVDSPLKGQPGLAVLVYAAYSSLGMHRLRLDQQKSVLLYLDSQDVRWVSGD